MFLYKQNSLLRYFFLPPYTHAQYSILLNTFCHYSIYAPKSCPPAPAHQNPLSIDLDRWAKCHII